MNFIQRTRPYFVLLLLVFQLLGRREKRLGHGFGFVEFGLVGDAEDHDFHADLGRVQGLQEIRGLHRVLRRPQSRHRSHHSAQRMGTQEKRIRRPRHHDPRPYYPSELRGWEAGRRRPAVRLRLPIF